MKTFNCTLNNPGAFNFFPCIPGSPGYSNVSTTMDSSNGYPICLGAGLRYIKQEDRDAGKNHLSLKYVVRSGAISFLTTSIHYLRPDFNWAEIGPHANHLPNSTYKFLLPADCADVFVQIFCQVPTWTESGSITLYDDLVI